jgi:hypothetical protein
LADEDPVDIENIRVKIGGENVDDEDITQDGAGLITVSEI